MLNPMKSAVTLAAVLLLVVPVVAHLATGRMDTGMVSRTPQAEVPFAEYAKSFLRTNGNPMQGRAGQIFWACWRPGWTSRRHRSESEI